MANLTYRADIDGLRAVAVVTVVLFHLGIEQMPGGFVGVDVFFVISGFLITTIIARELEEGRFSLLTFYERRVRRIFPALFAMIAVVLAIAAQFYMPHDLSKAAQSAVAATLFTSNLLFWWEAGYFDAAAYGKPLLHTWSLAIEEQFYIVIPLLMMVLARMRAGFALWIAGITLISLGLSVFTTGIAPTSAYYLLPWRAWELGLGALLALGLGPRLEHRALREGAAALGLAMILAAALMLDKSTRFPGSAALLPTVGAALILQAGRFGPSLTGRLLSMAAPVWIGKLSYSFYLWHWPVIVFFVYWTMDMPDLAEAAVLFLVALAFAWISWRFVEQPFRRPAGQAGQTRILLGGVTAMALLIGAGGALFALKGLPDRLPEEARRLAAFISDKDPRQKECLTEKNRDETWETPCLYGAPDTVPRVAVWGDSHASALIPALDAAGQRAGAGVALYARLACPPVDNFEWHQRDDGHTCGAFWQRARAAILEAQHIETVVLVMRPALYTEGWLDYGFGERGRAPLIIGTPDAPLADDADRAEFFVAGIARTIADLQAVGKSVALVYPVPELGNDVPGSLARYVLRGGKVEDMTLPRTQFDRRNGDLIARFTDLAGRKGVETIRLDQALCDDTDCRLVADGDPLYWDKNHISRTGALYLSPLFDPIFERLAEN